MRRVPLFLVVAFLCLAAYITGKKGQTARPEGEPHHGTAQQAITSSGPAQASASTPRPPTLEDSRAQRDRYINAIKSSGAGTPSGNPEVMSAVANLKRFLAQTGDGILSGPECYLGGCLVKITWRDEKDIRPKRRAAVDSTSWKGPSILTFPEPQPDGSVLSHLILYFRDSQKKGG